MAVATRGEACAPVFHQNCQLESTCNVPWQLRWCTQFFMQLHRYGSYDVMCTHAIFLFKLINIAFLQNFQNLLVGNYTISTNTRHHKTVLVQAISTTNFIMLNLLKKCSKCQLKLFQDQFHRSGIFGVASVPGFNCLCDVTCHVFDLFQHVGADFDFLFFVFVLGC